MKNLIRVYAHIRLKYYRYTASAQESVPVQGGAPPAPAVNTIRQQNGHGNGHPSEEKGSVWRAYRQSRLSHVSDFLPTFVTMHHTALT